MDRIDEFLNSAVAKAAGIKREMLEQLAAAYCLKTDIPPDECELVEQHAPTGMTWFFRRRGEIPEQKRVEPLATVIAEYPAEVRNDAQARREVEDIQYGSYCSCNNGQAHFAHCEKVVAMRQVLDAVIPRIQKECEALDNSRTNIRIPYEERLTEAEIDRIAERIVQKMTVERAESLKHWVSEASAFIELGKSMGGKKSTEPCDCGPPFSFTATIRPMTEEEKATCPLTNHGPCAVCSKDVIHTYPWWTARPDKPDAKPVHDECVRTLGVATREQPNCARCGAKHAWRGNPDGHEPGCEYSMPSAAQPANLPVDQKRTVCVCPRELVLTRGCQCGGN